MVLGTTRFSTILSLALLATFVSLGCRSSETVAENRPPAGTENGTASEGEAASTPTAPEPVVSEVASNRPTGVPEAGRSAAPSPSSPSRVGATGNAAMPPAARTFTPPQPPAQRTLPPAAVASARASTPVAASAPSERVKVQLLGVCSYTESAVSCWKPDGAPLKDLEPTVDGVLRSSMGYQQGRMRYGYKNRVIVFSRSNAQSNVTYRSADSSENGGSLDTQSTQESFGPKIDAVFVATAPGNPSGSIVAKVQSYNTRPKTGNLPLKAGSEVTVDGIKVRVVKVGKLAANDPAFNSGFESARNRPRWKVETTTDRTANPEAYSGFVLIGKNGRMFQYVDAKGRPVEQMNFNGRDPMIQAMNMIGDSSGGMSLILTVDPALVRSLQFSVTRPEVGEFRDIPLDPKR